MVIDSSTIRKNARREYEKVQRAIEKAKVDLERFRAEDQPGYTRWLHAHFGAMLTENRELQQKVFEAQGLVQEVQQEFYYGGYRSIHAAYAKVKWRREHPEEAAAEFQKEQEKAEALREAFEATFGKGAHSFLFGEDAPREAEAEFGPPPEWVSSEPAPAPEHPAAARIKDLYRALARRLHPDAGGKRSKKEMEWWHQTQTAYEAGDIEQMQLILTLAEMEEKGTTGASVSILQQITDQFKRGLNALRRELRRYRKDPAWDFSRNEHHTALSEQTRSTLHNEKQRLSMLLGAFQSQIQAWERLARPVPRPEARPQRRRRHNYEANPWF